MKSATTPLVTSTAPTGRVLWGRSIALGVAGTAIALIALPLTAGKYAPGQTVVSAPLPVAPLSFDLSPGDPNPAPRAARSTAVASPPATGSQADMPISDPFAANLESPATMPAPTAAGQAPIAANPTPNPTAAAPQNTAPTPATTAATTRPTPAAKANIAPPKPPAANRPAPNRQNMFWMEQTPQRAFNLQKDLPIYAQIFQSPTSMGVVAVGVAEGNYQLMVQNGALYVQPTPNYYGHTDPGNLSWGQRVTNFGPCSDQGRSGGNLATADRACVERLAGRLPTALTDLYAAGIDPYDDLQALVNAIDLYNQASPIHSRWFPQALSIARRGGLSGLEAYAWARTAAFYLDSNDRLDIRNGTNRASGLLGICSREGRPVTQWECVYADQARRVQAIATTYQSFLKLATNKSRRG
ncbi:MAG TPA: hypothetical protein V6D46_05695 [Coleofasciculaceae cyanobacterium]